MSGELTCPACKQPSGRAATCERCGAELRPEASPHGTLQDLEDAGTDRLQAIFQRAVGRLALGVGSVALLALWALGARSREAYAIAGGMAVVGLLLVLFGDRVTERLRRRRRSR